MPTIPQTQLVALANQMCSLMQNWRGDLQKALDLINQYAAHNAGAGFAAMPTCAVNADGSLGPADPAPVSANVIDNRVVSTMEVAISSYNLGVVYDILQAYRDLFEGNAVGTQTYAPAMLAATASDNPVV